LKNRSSEGRTIFSKEAIFNGGKGAASVEVDNVLMIKLQILIMYESNWSSLQKVEWHGQNLVELYGYKIT
jgi:hypothetical protein